MKKLNNCEYLLLDYPFAYCNDKIKDYIDIAVFIDTPLDVAFARGILRDMKNSSGDEIRNWVDIYLKYARVAYRQMQIDIMPSSDYVVNGDDECDNIVSAIIEIIKVKD